MQNIKYTKLNKFKCYVKLRKLGTMQTYKTTHTK